MSDRPGLRVIVIGAGIGGLCLAQGLHQAGIDVAVYERDRTPDARLQGYRLSIEPPGSTALHECLPPDLWSTLVALSGDQGEQMGVFTERLTRLMREDPRPDADDPAGGSHAVSRRSLRTILLAGLANRVHFDKEFVDYQVDDDGVVARFADGSQAQGDLLVGADGAGSRVRRQLLPHAGRVDLPAVGIGGKLALSPATLAWLPTDLVETKNMVLPRRDFLFTAVFRRRHASSGARVAEVTKPLLEDADDDDYVMWAYVAHRRSLAVRADLRGAALQDAVRRRMRRWDPALQRLIDESEPETVQQFAFSAARRVKPWSSGRVTLLGDAIHFMPPVGGMGGNTALQDARDLVRTLIGVDRHEATLGSALGSYEAEMLKRGFATVRGVRLYTTLAISRSRALRAVARGFFALCGRVGPLRRAVFSE